jgi:endonuclease-3
MAKKTTASKAATSKSFKPTATDLKTASQRAKKILPILYKTYPDAKCALNYKNALELMVATILSAQCTDDRVNKVTKNLFKRYKRATDFAQGPLEELEEMVRSTGFYRNKAKNIQAACVDIVEKFKGKVPRTLEELVTLAGVGRKTANVVLGNAFDTPGVVCDTHVIRLSRLMGLSKNTDPVKLEFDLMGLLPKKDWTQFCHMMIFHGRQICVARRPDCANCLIKPHCCYGQKLGE